MQHGRLPTLSITLIPDLPQAYLHTLVLDLSLCELPVIPGLPQAYTHTLALNSIPIPLLVGPLHYQSLVLEHKSR